VAIERPLLGKKNIISSAIEYLPSQATPNQVSSCIQKALKKIGMATPRVNISLSGPEIVFRYIQFPSIRDQEVMQTLRLEWDKYVPFRIEEMSWDYQVLGAVQHPLKGKQTMVLLAAAKRDFIEQQSRLFTQMGFTVDVIATNVTCLINAFNYLYGFKTQNTLIALLNIGESATDLVILKNGMPRFSRDILFGGKDITYMIAQKKRIDFQRAQELKHSFDANDTEVLNIIKNSFSNLVNEIKLSFEYLKRDFDTEVNAVYVCGGSSYLFGIEEFLKKDLGIYTEIWKLNNNLFQEGKDSNGGLEKHFAELAVAVGLALS
jgi:type IV pilus assembly protein PilM